MPLNDFTDISRIKFITSRNKFLAIEELAGVFSDCGFCTDNEELVRTLKEREEIMSTGIGFGIAVPHVKIPCVNKLFFGIGISRDGIDFDSMDGEPVHLIFMIVAGDNEHKEYLGLLSRIMELLKKDGIKDSIISADTARQVFSIISGTTTDN
jgi:fructose-specific phosphotransferase system IIA component